MSGSIYRPLEWIIRFHGKLMFSYEHWMTHSPRAAKMLLYCAPWPQSVIFMGYKWCLLAFTELWNEIFFHGKLMLSYEIWIAHSPRVAKMLLHCLPWPKSVIHKGYKWCLVALKDLWNEKFFFLVNWCYHMSFEWHIVPG